MYVVAEVYLLHRTTLRKFQPNRIINKIPNSLRNTITLDTNKPPSVPDPSAKFQSWTFNSLLVQSLSLWGHFEDCLFSRRCVLELASDLPDIIGVVISKIMSIKIIRRLFLNWTESWQPKSGEYQEKTVWQMCRHNSLKRKWLLNLSLYKIRKKSLLYI